LIVKSAARQAFKERLALIDRATLELGWHALGHRVRGFCLETLQLPPGAVVTLFGGLSDEIDLVRNVMGDLHAAGLRTAVFGLHVDKEKHRAMGEMDAYCVQATGQLQQGRYGIWEPNQAMTQRLAPEEVAVVLVPGLFFTSKEGARLGRGGGYFDRFLARTTAATLKVGVALDWQVVDSLPLESHDQRMDWLITETQVIRCQKESAV
jgi:5-formyltetrahydrofolate cyclo-ligase